MYDSRGNITTSSVVQPYADPRNATTSYVWDARWDFISRVTMPAGELRSIVYDTANGNRWWDEDARAGTNRTSYAYYTAGVAAGLLRAVVHPDGARDSVAYDTLGNLRVTHSPIGNEIRYENDRVGRTTVAKTQVDSGSYASTNWQDDSTAYDLMDRAIRVVSYGRAHDTAPAQSLVLQNQFDLEGNLKVAQRSIVPELNSPLGVITTSWDYDRAGRKIRETAPDGKADSLAYDPAGNIVDWYTRRRDANGIHYKIHMVYDTLNRLIQRTVPQVDYGLRSQGIATLVGLTGLGAKPYGGFSIPESITKFWYNTLGSIDSATNADATVRRRYFPNGQTQYDSLFIRWYDPASTNSHAYGLSYQYDVDGRRTTLKHPNQLAPRQGATVYDMTTYAYDTITGLPTRITDPLGNRFAFQYNTRDDLQSTVYPFDATGTEQYTYDLDGRLRTLTLANHDAQLRQVTYRYDARDKLLGWRNGVMMKDTLTSRYSGLGHITYSRARFAGVNQAGQGVASTVINTFANDALGDATNGSDTSLTVTSSGWGASSLYTGQNWWAGFVQNVGRLTEKHILNRRDSYVYDSTGNTEFSYTSWVDRSVAGPPPDEDRASFYTADGQLRVADYRLVAGHRDQTAESALWKRVVEYYRYDPLGRRVLVRSYRTCDNMYTENCRMGTIRRTVWDGDQELYEIQMPGDTLESQTWVENDTAYVNDRVDNSTAHGYFDQNPYFGRVLYTGGLSIDQPLGIIRMQYSTHPSGKSYQAWGRFSVYPHWSIRGEADLGSVNNGTWNYCVTFGDGQRCLNPWWYKGTFAYQREQNNRIAWFGTLVESKEDGTHTLYRRNRSYDPQSGHFTQEDPIGLAGGLNQYGFASGDPVTYSDPFGLCAQGDWQCEIVKAMYQITGAVIGGTTGFIGGAAAGVACGPLVEICSPVLAVAGAVVVGGTSAVAAGAAIDSYYDTVNKMARAGKGRGGNQNPNQDVARIVKEHNLNREGQRALHDEITGEDLSLEQIREIARRLAEQSKYLNQSPPQTPPR
jgi:RHS repeat-associated protein